jgi:four helix bundle protein
MIGGQEMSKKGEKNQSSYRSLVVWQKSFDLSFAIYHLTKDFPDSERYGLTSQMRRSAVSIPSNIAEGYGRGTKVSFHQFLRIAYGSAAELETQLLLAEKLGYYKEGGEQELLKEVMKMINAILAKEKES